MKIVTSLGTHTTAEGMRLSITYSQISESGEIVKSNERINRIIVDEDIKGHIEAVNEYAQGIIDNLE